MYAVRAAVTQCRIPASVASRVVRVGKRLVNDGERKELFDGEHVLKLSRRCYLMYFDSEFEMQTPHYHVGVPDNLRDLCGNGGGERNLYGVTCNGIRVRTPSQNIVIKSNSACRIHFPGSPPTIHQFCGLGSPGEGTVLISVHNNKMDEYGAKDMETYTVSMPGQRMF